MFTYPHIGNYGVRAAGDGVRPHPRARGDHARGDQPRGRARRRGRLARLAAPTAASRRSPASTRARSCATSATRARCAAAIFPARDVARREARERDRTPSRRWPGATSRARSRRASRVMLDGDGDGPRMVAIDTGIKGSIVRNLARARRDARAAPVHDARARSCSRATADAVFLANGPGDPAALDYVVDDGARARRQEPVFGICLGHQLLCRAVGLETFKLPFGHRGANHPVKDLATGRIEITSQNHGFAVLGPGGERRSSRRAGALGDRLRRRRAHAREPLRPHRRGARAARRARRHGPVPPRGRARARTTPSYLFDRFLETAAHAATRRHPQDPRSSAPGRS